MKHECEQIQKMDDKDFCKWLDSEELQEIDTHVAECAECQKIISDKFVQIKKEDMTESVLASKIKDAFSYQMEKSTRTQEELEKLRLQTLMKVALVNFKEDEFSVNSLKWILKNMAEEVAHTIASEQKGWDNVWEMSERVFQSIWMDRKSIIENPEEFKRDILDKAKIIAQGKKATCQEKTTMPEGWLEKTLDEIVQTVETDLSSYEFQSIQSRGGGTLVGNLKETIQLKTACSLEIHTGGLIIVSSEEKDWPQVFFTSHANIEKQILPQDSSYLGQKRIEWKIPLSKNKKVLCLENKIKNIIHVKERHQKNGFGCS